MSNTANKRFHHEAQVPHSGKSGSYRDEFNTTIDYDNGYRAAVRLANVLMQKHWPEAVGWEPAPDLLGVILQLDHITAHLTQPFGRPIHNSTPAISKDCLTCGGVYDEYLGFTMHECGCSALMVRS